VDPQTINVLVSVALVLLTVAALLFISSVLPLIAQAHRTFMAYEKLADTLDAEVPATLHEFRNLADRVNQLGSATTKSVSEVGHKVEEVSGSIGQAAVAAKQQSSVWGAGLLAGIKAYISPRGCDARDLEPPQSPPRIENPRGEQHVRQ